VLYLFYFDGVGGLCFDDENLKRWSTFLRKKLHPDDLTGGFSDLEMTWLLHCAGAATANHLPTHFMY